jgi:HlyD family secretion protein
MKSSYKTLIIILGILGLAVLAWFFFFRKPAVAVTLQVQKPTRGYIAQSVTATGKIEPVDTVTVGTQVSGILKYLYVDYNSKVKKGQLIAELDKSLLQAAYDQYKGALQSAQAQLVYQKNNFDRQNQLYKLEAISKADYDSAVNSLDAAESAVITARAQVASAAKNLSYADIYSPIDGVVLNRSISVGQTVAASFSTPTLFIIAKDITKMEVEASVDEADIGDVKAGNRASFSVDAFIDDQFGGTVEEVRLHPSVSANVVTYTTIINAPNDDMKLKPGMTANIVIYTKEDNNAMLIPSKALTFTPDSMLMRNYQVIGKVSRKSKPATVSATGNVVPQVAHTAISRADTSGVSKQKALVWVVQGKALVQKQILVGINDNMQVEVLSGLNANDLVATGTATGAGGVKTAGSSPFLPQRRPGGGATR